MIKTGAWQNQTIRDLTIHLEPDETVRALILTGSCARGQSETDPASDLDMVMVVADVAVNRFYPARDWLAPFGELFASDQSSNGFWSTLRVCFTDLRRIDFGIVTESALRQYELWPYSPFVAEFRILFSRSSILDAVLEQTPKRFIPSVYTQEQFQTLVNQFWFKGVLAVKKVIRNDLLIGLHLALDMVRDCCVVGMILRDRAAGTTHHRIGGAFNDVIARLDAAFHPDTAFGILNIIEQSSIAFDNLAMEWSNDYRARRQPLIEWIAYARQVLDRENASSQETKHVN